MAEPKQSGGIKIIAVNRYARHEYHILDTYEAGVALKGSEVKSLREGTLTLKEGYAHVKGGELFLEGVHIKPYSHADALSPPPIRSRKLLMHRKEIDRIRAEIEKNRYTLVPLRAYFKKGRVKFELGLAKGKKLYDKRQDLKKKAAEKQLQRFNKNR